MDKEDVKILKDDLLTLGLTPYEVEPLIKIAEVLPDSFGRSRFIGIGRDRLALVRPLLTKDNALSLLQLAEQHPTDRLTDIVEACAPTGEPRGLRLSAWSVQRIGRAFEEAGLVADSEEIVGDEGTLLRQITTLAAKAEAAQTFPVNAEKSSKIARLVLRVEGDRRWTLFDRSRLADEVQAVLRSNADALNAKLAKNTGVKARIAGIDAFYRGPDMPANGQRALEMDFDRADNPHPPGSSHRRIWNQTFQNPHVSILTIRG